MSARARATPELHRWLGPALVLLVFLTFCNILWLPFISDDVYLILKNRYLASWAFVPNLLTEHLLAGAGVNEPRYRPVELLTHLLDVRLWGYDAFGHHVTNLLIHLAASAAVFRLLARIAHPEAAFLAAAAFCVHPLQSIVVPVVACRADLMVALFLCLCLLTFHRHLGWSLLCAALAVGSKESGALVPIFVLLFDRMTGKPSSWKRHALYWALIEVYVVLRLTALNTIGTFDFRGPEDPLVRHASYRVYTFLSTLPMGLWLCVWPFGAHFLREWPVFTSLFQPVVLAGAGALGGLAAGIASAARRRAWPVAAGLAWFLVAQLPTANLLAVTYHRFADHFLILPGLGLTMALAWALSRAMTAGPRMRRAAWVGMSLIIVVFAVTASDHNQRWRDDVTLYGHIAALEPDSPRAHHNLGMAYKQAGRMAEAAGEFERSLALGRSGFGTHYQLGLVYLQLGDRARALEHFTRTAEEDPEWPGIQALIRRAGTP